MTTKIIDLHCDTFLKMAYNNWSLSNVGLHFSPARRPEDLRICQAAAINVSDDLRGKPAQDAFLKVYDVYKRELQTVLDEVGVLRDFSKLEQSLEEKPVVFFLTVEGGYVLGGELEWVDKLYDLGATMMTLTWNGANEICGGCDTGGGFTPFGRQVVARMEELGMSVDVSHLSDQGFWQLCEFATKPVCASHSNSRSICNHQRNLTDDMFREIARQGGIVGFNYHAPFIKAGGNSSSIEDLLRHLHHFLELGGEDAVALGSDFDGADIPPYLRGIEKLAGLKGAIISSGIPEKIADKVLYSNAYRYLTSFHK